MAEEKREERRWSPAWVDAYGNMFVGGPYSSREEAKNNAGIYPNPPDDLWSGEVEVILPPEALEAMAKAARLTVTILPND